MGKVIGLSKSYYQKGNCWYCNIFESYEVKDDNHIGVQVKTVNCRLSNQYDLFSDVKIGDDISYVLKDEFGRLVGVKKKEEK